MKNRYMLAGAIIILVFIASILFTENIYRLSNPRVKVYGIHTIINSLCYTLVFAFVFWLEIKFRAQLRRNFITHVIMILFTTAISFWIQFELIQFTVEQLSIPRLPVDVALGFTDLFFFPLALILLLGLIFSIMHLTSRKRIR